MRMQLREKANLNDKLQKVGQISPDPEFASHKMRGVLVRNRMGRNRNGHPLEKDGS